jgi:predicted ArsR family transcriptional regulator
MSKQDAATATEAGTTHCGTTNGVLDARILRWLLHYSLQRIEDIALGIHATEQTVRRHLQMLQESNLVESILFSYSSQVRHAWYHLTDAGIANAAAMENLCGTEAAQRWRTSERHLLHLLPRLPTLLAVQNVINTAILEAPEMLAYHGNPAAIRWCWQRECRVSFHDAQKRTVVCGADAAVVLRRSACGTDRKLYPHDEFFILWMYTDLGIAGGWSRQVMTARLRQLLHYRESLERQRYRGQFPLVLVLSESDLQVERWHQAISDAAYGLKIGRPLAAAILNLAMGPFKSIWEAPWRTLESRQFCTLQNMLKPLTMTREALPPGMLPAIPPIQAIGPIRQVGTAPRLVRGKFQSHAHITNKPTSLAKEREIIDLLGLEMSQRYRDVLLLLYAHPLTCAKELATFLGLAEQSLLRYLYTLSGWHCIESVKHEERGRAEKRWKLTERGLRYLAASQRLPLTSLIQTDENDTIWQPGVFLLQKQIRHTAGVYRSLAIIHQTARAEANHRIPWFESQMHCARRYQHQGIWHHFRPDATLLYEDGTGVQTQRWLLWLEWDRATMSREQLHKKLRTYAFYMRSREWRRLSYQVVPLLVFVTPERGQADTFRTLAEEIVEGAQMQVLVALRSLFEEHGFYAPIWYHVPSAAGSSILKMPFAAP